VVIPAHNAAATLDETLASLAAQTFVDWEAIVVDDGSTDQTVSVAGAWTARDSRIRLLRRPRGGVGASRNAGIEAARSDWLLFLDADDWLLPRHLARMTRRLRADARLDAVHCAWARVAPDGGRFPATSAAPAEDMFPMFARYCAFAIHACVVRRSLVRAVGGFPTDLVTCEDWDLWQRLARAGARFGAVPEVLALYRMRPGSACSNAERLVTDGLRVIRQGHAPDPRVTAPLPRHANGQSPDGLPAAAYACVAWAAGLVLGQGRDARPLLRLLGDLPAPGLDPLEVARSLWDALPMSGGRTPQQSAGLFAAASSGVDAFLAAVEERSGAPELASRARRRLEWLVGGRAEVREPLTVGVAHWTRVDADRPVADVTVPEGVDRLYCVVETGGRQVGAVHVPAVGGAVAGTAIAGAIESELAWPLFLEHVRQGPLRSPRLWLRLGPVSLESRTVRTALDLVRRGTAWRRSPKLKRFALDTARRLVRDAGLVAGAPAGPDARSAATRLAAVIEAARTSVPARSDAARVLVEAGSFRSPGAPPGPGPRRADRGPSPAPVTRWLPVLMYHRVADTSPEALRRYRVTPDRFEAQLAYLRRHGYHGVTVGDWRDAIAARRPLPGRAVLLTFDDGYRDFLTHAWPLLRQYGFPATVFVVADAVGGAAVWDRAYGEPAPLLSWPEIRGLRDAGVSFGSHTADHRPLTALSAADVLREGARSRVLIERELGEPVTTLAYPYGDCDPAVRRLMAACGYDAGLTTQSGLSGLADDPMAIPRVEVTCDDDVATFAAKIGAPPRGRAPWLSVRRIAAALG
jgi:peptidoglycan/xylan/chitin deacetylase (PgdA/CDA1 family)